MFGHISYQSPIPIRKYRETGGDNRLGAGVRLNFYLMPKPDFPLQFGLDLGLFGRGGASWSEALKSLAPKATTN